MFEAIVNSGNALLLQQFFASAYSKFCNNPEVVGFNRSMVSLENNDTDPGTWNADVFKLKNDDAVALCYIPIENDTISARIFGIILSGNGDGYYYSTLNKNDNSPSIVNRNRARLGVEQIGKAEGRGFELMNDFLNCIAQDFYQTKG